MNLNILLKKMLEAHIIQSNRNSSLAFEICDISFYGIQLLNAIRPMDAWNKTKSIIKQVGNHSLKFVEETAQMVATELANRLSLLWWVKINDLIIAGLPA